MANAAKAVRATFLIYGNDLSLSDIKAKTGLKSSEISMALCHLRKMNHLVRTQRVNTGKGRKMVWVYTYVEHKK